jgi:hypothetical protein
MIFHLRNLIPQEGVSAQIETGQWVRAMHEPFYGGFRDRLNDAREVLLGRAFAVRWPKHGEFEQAIAMSEQRK